MQIKETYTEKFTKNYNIIKEEALETLRRESLNVITLQKRGMCKLDGEIHEFMQVTLYFKKEI